MHIYKSIPVETIPKNDINEHRLCNNQMIEHSPTEIINEEVLVLDMANTTKNISPINYDDWQDPNELVKRLKVAETSRLST